MNIKLNLKVLNEIQEDLARVQAQIHRFKDPEVQAKYREQVAKMQDAAKLLHQHYEIILKAQK